MTVREVIQQRCLIANLVIWIGFILFAMSNLYYKSIKSEDGQFSTFACFALFMAGVLYAFHVAGRCPSCRGSIYWLLMKQFPIQWLSDDIQHCPCCSLRFEDEWKGKKISEHVLVKPSATTKSDLQAVTLQSDATPLQLTGRMLIENQRRIPLCLYWIATGVSMFGIVTCWFSIYIGGALIIVGLPLYLYAKYYLDNRACSCPWCHTPLKELLFENYTCSMPPEFKVCPYCARKFDDVVKGQAAQKQA